MDCLPQVRLPFLLQSAVARRESLVVNRAAPPKAASQGGWFKRQSGEADKNNTYTSSWGVHYRRMYVLTAASFLWVNNSWVK